MAKLQLTPDWMIGPKNAGKAVLMWAAIAIAIVGAVWFVSQGGLAAETEIANQTVEVNDSTDLVYVDINTTASADGSNVSTVELINESDGTKVDTRNLTLNESTVVSAEFDTDELDLAAGNYTVTVTGEETDIESVEIGTTEESGGTAGGPLDGRETEAGVAAIGIIAIALGAVLARGQK